MKGCERQLGIDRGKLSDVDGYYAVVLWETHKRTGHQKSLEMLIEYNSMDARNLEVLMEMAYERKVTEGIKFTSYKPSFLGFQLT